MNIQEYIEKEKFIQEKLVIFIENENDEEENYESLIKALKDHKIKENKNDLKIFLYLLSSISTHHHRNHNFFNKIEKIIEKLKNKIQKYYSNYDIFKIFKQNKRILLFLIEIKMITIDQIIYNEMMKTKYKNMKYPEYFSFEIKSFIEEDKQVDKKYIEKIKEITEGDYDQFNKKRKNGENDGYLYKIIQNDSIEEFIIFVNKENYLLKSYVEESIFETNLFLLRRKKISLIEYASFFGSVQIFKYLYKNGVDLKPSLWIYAVQSDNDEMIYLLEENHHKFDIDNISYSNCFLESIKCHHIDVSNYLQNNYLNNREPEKSDNFYDINDYDDNIISFSFCYYNFLYIPENVRNQFIFIQACKYDYFTFVKLYLTTYKINLNDIKI